MQKDLIVLLLDYGAKRTATDMDNQTPIDLLSQPLYNYEISKFKVSEDEEVVEKPKRGRPRKNKVDYTLIRRT